MQFVIINQSSGMFSDFLASEISKNPGFANDKPVSVFGDNQYKYPNYLEPIGVDVRKIASTSLWPISSANLDDLSGLYQSLKVVLVTDWCNELAMTGLPSLGIYPYSSDESLFKLAFCMYMIKYRIKTTTPSTERQQEINQLIANNHPYKTQLAELLNPGQYAPWKFLAYKNEILNNGQLDLRYYMENSYQADRTMLNSPVSFQNWFNFDLAGPLLNNSGYEGLETLLGVTIDKPAVQAFHNANVALLTEKTGLTMASLSDANWMDSLYNYCNSI